MFLGQYPFTSVCFSVHGEKLYVGGIDNDIHVYDVGMGKKE